MRIRQQRNTKEYLHFKDRDVLDIEGTMSLTTPIYRSTAAFKDNGVFELFAKFDTHVPFNEHAAKRYLAPKLAALFSPTKYLLIVECLPHKMRRQRNLGRYTNIEYYALCDKPDPSKVQMLQGIVRDMIDECEVSEEPVENETF